MRRLVFLAATLIAFPAFAADLKDAPTMSFSICGSKFSCSAYSGLERNDPRLQALVVEANNCVTQNFGIRSNTSHFRDELGFDYSRCLSSVPLPKAPTGVTPTPYCCIVESGGDACHLRCELKGVR